MDAATVALGISGVAAAGTIYAAITGFKTASATVSREDWDATLEQARKDRAELREANDGLRKDNAQLVADNRQLRTVNVRLRAEVDDVKLEMGDLRNGLARALEHVTHCEAELAALRGET